MRKIHSKYTPKLGDLLRIKSDEYPIPSDAIIIELLPDRKVRIRFENGKEDVITFVK